jgi:hypothetical protein
MDSTLSATSASSASPRFWLAFFTTLTEHEMRDYKIKCHPFSCVLLNVKQHRGDAEDAEVSQRVELDVSGRFACSLAHVQW